MVQRDIHFGARQADFGRNAQPPERQVSPAGRGELPNETDAYVPAAAFVARRHQRETNASRRPLRALGVALLMLGAPIAAAAEGLSSDRSRQGPRRWAGHAPREDATPLGRKLLQFDGPLSSVLPGDGSPSPAYELPGTSPVAPPAEYYLGWHNDSDVLPNQAYEQWGVLYRPLSLTTAHPLVFLVHGQHQVCSDVGQLSAYLSDSCTKVANHAGYEYLGQSLASHGMVVASINMNAINAMMPSPEHQARGRLLLQTLELFSNWTTAGGAPESLGLGSGGLVGRLDMQQIGLLGHSRGGEGVLSAYNLLQNGTAPWAQSLRATRIGGVFGMAPVDSLTGDPTLDARGVPWTVLLPTCDGDVADLQGFKPFDRMVADPSANDTSFKAAYTVWGGNHNNMNTVWAPQPDNSLGCAGVGSPTLTGDQQRAVAQAAVSSFFRATLQGDLSALELLNPLYPLPEHVRNITRVERSYVPDPSQLATVPARASTEGNVTLTQETLGSIATGLNPTSMPASANRDSFNDMVDTPHTQVLTTRLQWEPGDVANAVEFDVTQDNGKGIDLQSAVSLDARLSRVGTWHGGLNSAEPTDFELRLVDSEGRMSQPVPLSDFMELSGPAGLITSKMNNTGTDGIAHLAVSDSVHLLLQTLRLPTSVFTGVNLRNIQAVRIELADGTAGDIAVTPFTVSYQDF